jgi:hypothetical protein
MPFGARAGVGVRHGPGLVGEALCVLLVASITFRRLATLRALLAAAALGALAGLLTLGLPSPALVERVFPLLVVLFASLLVLPLVAALPTGDRRGGYEQLQGSRPLASLSWAAGRLAGSVLAGLLLALVLATLAQEVAGGRMMPRRVPGLAMSADAELWRFALPAGARGPFDLRLETYVPFAGSGTLELEVQRGTAQHAQTLSVLPVRELVAVLPDLAPQRGDLYVTLRPGPGTVLGSRLPELVVGSEPLGSAALALATGHLARLLFALLWVLAAAHAFRFETACLAGLLALALEPPQQALGWSLVAAAAVGWTALGSALQRRQALP